MYPSGFSVLFASMMGVYRKKDRMPSAESVYFIAKDDRNDTKKTHGEDHKRIVLESELHMFSICSGCQQATKLGYYASE